MINGTRASGLTTDEITQGLVSPTIGSAAPGGVKLFYDESLNKITRANEGGFWVEIKTGTTAVPTPKIMIDIVSLGSPINNFIQANKYDLSSNIDVAKANGPVYLGVQWDITDKDKNEWLNNNPFILMHTKRGVYPDRGTTHSGASNSNNEDITHIPNTPSALIVGTGTWGNKIQIEPLNRTGSNYGSGHTWFNGGYSGGTVPSFESEWNFTSTKPGHIEILKIDPFNFLQGLQTATLPIRVVDATYDNKYNFYMHSKTFNGKINPHTIIKLYFTFGYIDADGKSVIQGEYSEPVYLYMKSQELEKPNPNDPGDRYLVDWIISHKPPK